jgi:hypothetical protein
MVKNRRQAYLEPISDSMQKPIGGLSENDRGRLTINAQNQPNHAEKSRTCTAATRKTLIHIRKKL